MIRFFLSLFAALILAIVGFSILPEPRARAIILSGAASAGPPTGSCSQSTAWFSRVWALPATLDGTVGGSGHVAAYDTMICGLVSDGLWTGGAQPLDALWIRATNTTSGAAQSVALMNLISSSFTSTANGSPTFTADAGYTGVNGSSTVWIDTGVNLSTTTNFTQNSGSILTWSLTNNQATGSGGTANGAENASFTQTTQIDLWTSAGHADFFINVNATAPSPNAVVTSASGSWIGSRTTSSLVIGYNNGTALTMFDNTAASVAPISLNMFSLAANVNGTAAGGIGNQIAATAVGTGLDATHALALHNRICTYLTAVHGSC